MRQLSPSGALKISGISKSHGFSDAAVISMLESVVKGNGSMAQFDHPEFGGSGQWMRGGMIMISDMFNDSLKARTGKLCSELSDLVSTEPDFAQTGTFQSQTQSDRRNPGTFDRSTQGAPSGSVADQSMHNSLGPQESLFIAPTKALGRPWWPTHLGVPSSTGSQNEVSYAYFSAARRLAIQANSSVTVYDTLDHNIGGFSQQQSDGASLSFNSQHGPVDIARLPVIEKATSDPRAD